MDESTRLRLKTDIVDRYDMKVFWAGGLQEIEYLGYETHHISICNPELNALMEIYQHCHDLKKLITIFFTPLHCSSAW